MNNQLCKQVEGLKNELKEFVVLRNLEYKETDFVVDDIDFIIEYVLIKLVQLENEVRAHTCKCENLVR